MFLDKWQYTIAEMEGVTYGQDGRGIPVLTYEEMAGLVLGYDPGNWVCRCTRWMWSRCSKNGHRLRSCGQIPGAPRKIHRETGTFGRQLRRSGYDL